MNCPNASHQTTTVPATPCESASNDSYHMIDA
jgi:hypothetical protein